jgi:hypothetical protein
MIVQKYLHHRVAVADAPKPLWRRREYTEIFEFFRLPAYGSVRLRLAEETTANENHQSCLRHEKSRFFPMRVIYFCPSSSPDGQKIRLLCDLGVSVVNK